MSEADAERYQRISELVSEALALPPDQRSQYLARSCGGDAELCARARSLLESLGSGSAALPTDMGRRVVAGGAASLLHEIAPPPEVPDAIGPFRVVGVLGQGGMGVVYEAEQSRPVERRVALKVLLPGVATREVLARFEAERQALSAMDHPGIAKVLDAGATDDGRPWFAMELVQGPTLDVYCARERLTTRARVELLVEACRAVQHAHQKGVIHRDLKPSNVLVVEHDGRPQPKIIDFGIAKAIGRSLTAETLVTQLGQVLGTPAYMAPEQAAMTGLDVDTRADVYALGVMAFEQLVGRLPVDVSADWQGTLRALARGERDLPSMQRCLSELTAQALADIAFERRCTPHELERELRGDLEWILGHAMAPERGRRYATAEDLAADLERHLADEPVLARPPTLTYRASKFVRRHRVGVGATGLVALVLVTASIGLTVLWLRSVAAERRMREEAQTAQRVVELMERLFEVSDPAVSQGAEPTAREVLGRGADAVRAELADEPELEARLLGVIGRVHASLGLYWDADRYLEQALALRRTLLEPGDPALAADLVPLAEVKHRLKRRDHLVRALMEECVRLTRGRPDDPFFADCRMQLAWVEPGRARELLEEALASSRRVRGRRHAATARILGELSRVVPPERAIPLLEEALSIERERRPANPVASARLLLGLSEQRARIGDGDRALARSAEALGMARGTFGAVHARLPDYLTAHGRRLLESGEPEAGRALFEEAIAVARLVYGTSSRFVAELEHQLGRELLYRLGDAECAGPLLEEAAEIERGKYGVVTVSTGLALVQVLRTRGRAREAARLGAVVLAEARAGYPGTAWELRAVQQASAAELEAGRFEAALVLAEEALRLDAQLAEPGAPPPWTALATRARAASALGDAAEAVPLLEEAVEILGGVEGGHPSVAALLAELARARDRAGLRAESVAAWREAIAAAEIASDSSPAVGREARRELAALLRRLGRDAEAAALDAGGRAEAAREGS